MKEVLSEKYNALLDVCGIGAFEGQEAVNAVIRQSLRDFTARCSEPAIWCYGRHTKMLMADFIFELKKVRFIIDNGAGSQGDGGFEVIRESGIAEKRIDGIIISSRVYRDEIAASLRVNYAHIPYLDIYAELEKAGILLDAGYYAERHPYSVYCGLNGMQRSLSGEAGREACCSTLEKIIKKYIEIKDFKSAMKYTEKLIGLRGDMWEGALLEQLREIYGLQQEAMKGIHVDNVLMLCMDGLRRREVREEHMGNLCRFLKQTARYYSNAYSVSTSTFESLISVYSENMDLRTKYYEADTVAGGKCRFIREAKRQGRKICFYTDGAKFVDDDAISVKSRSQTATEKLWDFLLDAADEKNGLFYIHILYESHYSYPNPYTEEKIVADGSNILFDYLEGNGGRIRTDYGRQQKDALRYLDDVVVPLVENLQCRMVFYADHGNILIDEGAALEDVEKTKYTFHEDLVQVPFAVKSPETGTGTEAALTSLMELNNAVISLLKKEKASFRQRDHVKLLRSEIYNPDFRHLYKKADYEQGLLAFEVFIFAGGHKLAVYADGRTELYLAATDCEINDMPTKRKLLNDIRGEVTVCGPEHLERWRDG